MSKHLKAEDYRKAIRAARGVVAAAARKLGVSRQSVYNAINKYSTVRDTLEEQRKTTVDLAEGKLISIMMDDGHKDQMKAIQMVLRTQGGERWQETQRHELHHQKLEDVTVTVQGEMPDIVIPAPNTDTNDTEK